MQRKKDHIDICLNRPVNADYDYWSDIRLIHQALPGFDLAEVDTSCELFGKKLGAPVVISAITGGHEQAESINRNLAQGAARFGLAMGVGSQRPALKNDSLRAGYQVLMEFDLPLVIGNIGAPQLVAQKGAPPLGADQCRRLLEMIGGDVLAVHLNFTQEVVQLEGDHNARGGLEAIGNLAGEMPVMVKETGAGISRGVALALKERGVMGLDVGGLGGTSFPAVEHHRAVSADNWLLARLGNTFRDWGIPTPVSLLACRVGLPLIATGGLTTGLDVARALALGAEAGGLARGLLRAATESADAVNRELEALISELKAAMFLSGARTVTGMAEVPYVVLGRTAGWLEQMEREAPRTTAGLAF